MDIKALEDLLSNRFNSDKFFSFIRELTKHLRQNNEGLNSIDDDFYRVEPVQSFQDSNGLNLHVVIIHTSKPSKIEKARIEQREIIRKYINQNIFTMPNGILAVFYNENYPLWRLSYTEIDWERSGKLKTPPRRYSYLIGEGEPIHTPAKQLSKLIENPPHTIDEIKEAFSVEKLTDEFFKHYRNLYIRLKEHIEKEPANIPLIENLKQNGYSVDDFAKKLLGQLVFLYFLQKKGWLGVPENKPYGEGDKKFLRNLFEQGKKNNRNFYNEYLIPLFYETLNNPRENQMIPDWSDIFNCRIPFLNGGLFEPIYDHKNILIHIDNQIFSNENEDGILDIFDIYNFTVKEDEPLEKEVAVDPEMLGKVFENLIAENERKGQGAFYTPREIVHYMSQQSLIYYLSDKLNLPLEDVKQIFTKENFDELPESIKKNDKSIDNELKNIKIVDPACGSGAFLVGVLHELVKARSLLNKNSNPYHLKKEAIENSIYGVDIDIGATEIAKLRLWLSLVVDEDSPYEIEPLPNLEYKIMCGNSLLEELVIGDEVIQLSVESEYKKDITLQINSLEKELDEKRKILLELAREKGKNNEDVKRLEKEVKKVENKIKNLKGKPKQKVSSSLLGIVDLNEAFEEIKNLQHQFFNEHNPDKKRQLKERIDEKLKDFVLRKIDEEEQKIKNKINTIVSKTELESYKKKLNFRGCNKNFFLWHLNFSEVFIEKDGFDVVIANPPYVGEAGHKNLLEEVRRASLGKRFGQGKMDYFHFFLQKAIHDISHNKSVISFITTNYYFTGAGASKLRKSIKENTDILELINFNELKIFDTAQGQHNAIIFLSKNKKDRNCLCILFKEKGHFKDKQDKLERILFEKKYDKDVNVEIFTTKYVFDDNEYIVPQNDGSLIELKNKIKENAVYFDNKDLSTGIDVHQDFVVNKHLKILGNKIKVGKGIFVLSDKELEELKLTQKEKEDLIRPYYTTNELKKYCGNPENKYWIIYTTTEKIKQIDKYPNIKKHLNKFKKIITSDFAPYGLHRARDEYFFKGKKIISKRMTKEPVFTYTDFDCYVSQTFFVIKPRSEKLKDIDLKFLTGLLNSKLSYWYFYNFGKRKGEQLQIDKQPLMSFPIKLPDKKTEQKISNLVDKICELTSREDYEHNPDLQSKVQEYSNQIDQLVYKLYNLTDEEIERIERKIRG